MRHVEEAWAAFLSPFSMEKSQPLVINYDAVLPDSRKEVARDVDACRNALNSVREGLCSLADASDLSGELERDVIVSSLSPVEQEFRSTLGREVSHIHVSANRKLWFCALHTIHHYTMIRAIAVHELVSCNASRH